MVIFTRDKEFYIQWAYVTVDASVLAYSVDVPNTYKSNEVVRHTWTLLGSKLMHTHTHTHMHICT